MCNTQVFSINLIEVPLSLLLPGGVLSSGSTAGCDLAQVSSGTAINSCTNTADEKVYLITEKHDHGQMSHQECILPLPINMFYLTCPFRFLQCSHNCFAAKVLGNLNSTSDVVFSAYRYGPFLAWSTVYRVLYGYVI